MCTSGKSRSFAPFDAKGEKASSSKSISLAKLVKLGLRVTEVELNLVD